MKNGSIEKGPLPVPIPTVLLQTNLNLPTIRYALQMLSDIVIMTAALDYLICKFIIKFNNRENLFLEQNETLQPLQQ